MKMLRLLVIVSAVLIVTTVWLAKTRASAHAAAQIQLFNSGCVSFVPREWGAYRGGSAQSGLAFEDSAGTLRFVTNLPCGAVPAVALEVHRGTGSN
jgi:hypothetical protein